MKVIIRLWVINYNVQQTNLFKQSTLLQTVSLLQTMGQYY